MSTQANSMSLALGNAREGRGLLGIEATDSALGEVAFKTASRLWLIESGRTRLQRFSREQCAPETASACSDV